MSDTSDNLVHVTQQCSTKCVGRQNRLVSNPSLFVAHISSHCAGDCPTNFLKAMETEHCDREGHGYKFQTSNYTRIITHPKKEWGIVVKKEPCPQEEMKCSRRIPDIDELLELPLARRSALTRHEVIAVVLYSGPMVSCDRELK